MLKLLIKHYGENWQSFPELEFYKRHLDGAINENLADLDENDTLCEQFPEGEVALKV